MAGVLVPSGVAISGYSYSIELEAAISAKYMWVFCNTDEALTLFAKLLSFGRGRRLRIMPKFGY
jgi:hypothetical protein